MARTKRGKEESIEAQREKLRTPTLASDALIVEEEEIGNKERNREWVSNPDTLDPSVTSYEPQGSYSEPTLVISPAHRGNIYMGRGVSE